MEKNEEDIATITVIEDTAEKVDIAYTEETLDTEGTSDTEDSLYLAFKQRMLQSQRHNRLLFRLAQSLNGILGLIDGNL